MKFYYISVNFKNGIATGAVFIENNKIVRTAPIFYKSLIGKSLDYLHKYVKSYNGIIEEIL